MTLLRLRGCARTAFGCLPLGLSAACIILVPVAAVLQQSSATYPVPPDQQADGSYRVAGWTVASLYGWRSTVGGRPDDPPWELHGGVDLAGAGFGMGAPLQPILDGEVTYVGWDCGPDCGGGQVVRWRNSQDDATDERAAGGPLPATELTISYSHLQPYRVHVRTATRVGWSGPYTTQAVGTVSVSCPGSLYEDGGGNGERSYAHATPGQCSARVHWPRPFVADSPTELRWDQGLGQDGNQFAYDAQIQFLAHEPPPPTPTPEPTPADTATPAPRPTWPLPTFEWQNSAEGEEILPRPTRTATSASNTRPVWTPTASRASLTLAGDAQPRVEADTPCGPRQQLLHLPARARDPRLVSSAAVAWYAARDDIRSRLGIDWLGEYPSDMLRPPDFVPTRSNQIFYSWHKTGRAVDVPQTGPRLRHVQEGAYERLYVDSLDVTAIMEGHGFRRIPSSPGRPEWWHYELREGLSWQAAMLQIYPVEDLRRWFPRLDWDTPPCTGDDPDEPFPGGSEDGFICQPDGPDWTNEGGVRLLRGCGPPLQIGSHLRQMGVARDAVAGSDWVGFVGMTGRTTGPHLHLAVQSWASWTDVCVPPYLPEGMSRADMERLSRDGCWTSYADPMDYLPLAHADSLTLRDATGRPVPDPAMDSQPMQLPPPNTAETGLLPDAPDQPPETRNAGTWWSPGNRWSNLGGGSLLDWLWGFVRRLWCWLFPWWC